MRTEIKIQIRQKTKDLSRSLFDAARKEDWKKVDKTLLSDLGAVNHDFLAGLLLPKSEDHDPNIRDVVASTLSCLSITTDPMRNAATTAMIKMATTDEFVFPSGRAATYLLKNADDKKRKQEIADGIERFKQRARERNWAEELIENIPEIAPLLSDLT